MNWMKALVAGVAGGIVVTVVNFVIHGFIMANTYLKYPIFAVQEPANPVHFPLVAIFIAIPAAVLFAKTRNAWPSGLMGGLSCGFWIGMVAFFMQFYHPMVLEGFPYYLAWCWGGINLIGFLVLGAVMGILYKK